MTIDLRKGMPDPHLSKDAFRSRFFGSYSDPAFDALAPELEQAFEVAWQAYEDARKAPRTRPGGPGFTDPAYQTSVEWLAAHDAIAAAELRHRDPAFRPDFFSSTVLRAASTPVLEKCRRRTAWWRCARSAYGDTG